MLRILTFAFFIATLGMAGVLFKIKYDTRSLQLEMVRLRQQIGVERQQVAVVKAEWSILTTPKRIDKIARQIGLIPLSPEQIISFRDLEALPMDKSQPFASLSPLAEPSGSVVNEVDMAEGKDTGLKVLEDFDVGADSERSASLQAGAQKLELQKKKIQNSDFQKGAFLKRGQIKGISTGFESVLQTVNSGKQDLLHDRRAAVTDFIKRASFEGSDLKQADISNNGDEVTDAN